MKKKNKTIWWTTITLLVMAGTYNAVVINTHSQISSKNIPFIKKLDEIYGQVNPSRTVATGQNWQKIAAPEAKATAEVQLVASNETTAPTKAAAIQEQLKLELVEVSNPQKWKEGLTKIDFEGSLSTSNGVLEEFHVSLPSGDEISISHMEMDGNGFSYDLEGEIYAALIFQADQNSYLVTLNNGPLEGTRMRFKKEASLEEVAIADALIQDHGIQVGSFGEDSLNMQQSAALSPEAELPFEMHSFTL